MCGQKQVCEQSGRVMECGEVFVVFGREARHVCRVNKLQGKQIMVEIGGGLGDVLGRSQC